MPLINILISVSAGQEEVVNELVGAGADVNRKNDKGITPLFVSRVLAVCFFHAFHGPTGTMQRQSHVLRSGPFSRRFSDDSLTQF
jgi:hypothetical protein